MKAFLVFVMGLALILWGVSYIPGAHGVLRRVIDREPPVLTIADYKDGTLKAELVDLGAGLADVTILAKQTERSHQIYSEQFVEGAAERSVSLPFDPQALGFKEGPLTVEVLVKDRAYFANSASSAKQIDLDFVRPTIELLSLQHKVNQGGAELVIFRAIDTNLQETGVMVGELRFPGFPISHIDPTFDAPGLYGVLLALPFGFDSSRTKVVIYARDGGNNRVEYPISFRVGNLRLPEVQSKLKLPFLQQKIPQLYDKYVALAGSSAQIDLGSPEGLVEAFKLVNESYRRLLDQELLQLLQEPISSRQGQGVFLKPMSSATSSNLGEQRHYSYLQLDAGFSVHNGLDLASVQNDKVIAAQAGKVLLAKDHGIYGNTVVIDHGLGISTLYGHLASIMVQVGDQVDQGVVIGSSGQTGLAGGDHLHFEVRVFGLPVNPIEWWDAKWIEDHIDGKVKAARAAATLSQAQG